MKKLLYFTVVFYLMFISCTKQSETNSGALLLTGIQGSKGSNIVCINIDSGLVVNTTPIDCYELSSTVYDLGSGGYGYVNCDTMFKLVNPVTGDLIKSIKLPGMVSQVVIDNKDNMLIGRYSTMTYGDDPDTIGIKSAKTGLPIYTDYVIRVNLSTGTIVSKSKINVGNGVYATTYYYDEKGKHYILYRSDNSLITINPSTGEIIKERYVGKILVSSVYNPFNNTLISLSYPKPDSQEIYLSVINPETGDEISSNLIESGEGYYANIAGYDKENNWYIAVNTKYEVVCFDVSTGEIKKRYELENPLTDIKFWRR